MASIELCLGVLTEVNAKMLEFDFRNGPLRRKYDGLKYALRSMEDILFELSLQSPCATEVEAAGVQAEECSSPTKRMRLEESATSASAAVFKFIDAAEIDAIRQRMDRYDQLRELVIKDSRDVQKLAKQAVFAVIRGQLVEAHKKLDQAAVFAKKILETVNQVDYILYYDVLIKFHSDCIKTVFCLTVISSTQLCAKAPSATLWRNGQRGR